jgi:hypothetical protein
MVIRIHQGKGQKDRYVMLANYAYHLDNVADGAQGFENNHALYSRRSASTRRETASTCPQMATMRNGRQCWQP